MTTLERVRRAVADVMRLPVTAVAPASCIEDLGETDSLTLAEIATALDADFGVRVPSEGLTEARTVADLARLVDGLLQAGPSS